MARCFSRATATRTCRVLRRWSLAQKFFLAVFAAKIERLSVSLGMRRGCFVYGHATNGIFGHVGSRYFWGKKMGGQKKFAITVGESMSDVSPDIFAQSFFPHKSGCILRAVGTEALASGGCQFIDLPCGEAQIRGLTSPARAPINASFLSRVVDKHLRSTLKADDAQNRTSNCNFFVRTNHPNGGWTGFRRNHRRRICIA